MESSVAFVLGNAFVVLFAIAVVTTFVKARRFVRERKPYSAAYILWGELLLYAIGIWFVYTGVLHAYFQQITAPSIGWLPSPFEYELGWIEIPLGVVAIASLWRGYEFRLASTIVVATFGLAAAAQHIQQMTCCRNFSPSNAGPILWFADIFLPLLLTLLAVMSRDEGPAQRRPYA